MFGGNTGKAQIPKKLMELLWQIALICQYRVFRVLVWQAPILSRLRAQEQAPLLADYLELRRHLSCHMLLCRLYD